MFGKMHTRWAAIAIISLFLTLGSMQEVYAGGLHISAGAAKALGEPQVGIADTFENGELSDVSLKGNSTSNVPENANIAITVSPDSKEEANSDTTTTYEEQEKLTGEVAGIPYDKLVMANVHEAVNVRSEASEDAELVGKFYSECGGMILDSTEGWTKVATGDLTGWICNDYLLFGQSAVDLAKSVVEMTATSKTSCLRIRKEPNADATILSLLAEGEQIEAVEELGDWVKVQYSDGDVGYVSAGYVSIADALGTGETMESIRAREEEEKKAREAAAAEAKKAEVAAGRTTETTLTNNGAIDGDINDVLLLAALIQCEAGNQPYEGQVSVGTVVMNRLRTGRYGTSIYSVIYAKGQFGPAGSGKVAAVYAAGPKAICIQAAEDAMAGTSYIGTATHFRNISSGYMGIVIGSHVFW